MGKERRREGERDEEGEREIQEREDSAGWTELQHRSSIASTSASASTTTGQRRTGGVVSCPFFPLATSTSRVASAACAVRLPWECEASNSVMRLRLPQAGAGLRMWGRRPELGPPLVRVEVEGVAQRPRDDWPLSSVSVLPRSLRSLTVNGYASRPRSRCSSPALGQQTRTSASASASTQRHIDSEQERATSISR